MGEPEAARDRDIIGVDGRIIMFSVQRFLRDICAGDHCFLCGISPQQAPFNMEHVIPRWVLARYRLFNFMVNLPNGRQLRWDRATIPCCQPCNSFLGRTVETPISALLHGTPSEIAARIGPQEREMLFQWLCLLFVKIHLKHRAIRWHPNPQNGQEMIGDAHDWIDFHHIFEVARAPYSGAKLAPGIVGSFHIFEVNDDLADSQFDFVDMTEQKALMIRPGNIGLVAVLDDACIASFMVCNILKIINGPLNGVQLREVAARLAMANGDILRRPTFQTMYFRHPIYEPEARLTVTIPPYPWDLAAFDNRRLGRLLLFALGELVGGLEIDGNRDPAYVRAQLESGEVSFIYDGRGRFFNAHNERNQD